MANPTQSRPPSPSVSIEEIELTESQPPSSNIETPSEPPPPYSTAEEVSLFIEGGDRNNERLLRSSEVYDCVCTASDEDFNFEDSEVKIMYINSSHLTRCEAVTEAMHISSLRGEPVRLIYNDGRNARSCPLSIRPHFPSIHDYIPGGILSRWNEFFTSPSNQNREYIVFFSGNGGLCLQVALDNSIYSERILCVGIGASYYIQGSHRVHHYRVIGDWLSLLHSRLAQPGSITTIPYADSAEGIFNPSVRCPSYQSVLLFGEQCLMTSQEHGILENPIPPISRSRAPEISLLIDLDSNSGAMARLVAWMNEGDSSAVLEFNPQPNNCRDVALTALYATTRISSLLQEVLILSVTYSPDVFVSYAIVTGYSIMTLRYFILLLTNRPGCRRRCRAVRLGFLALQPLGFLSVLLDHINVARRVNRQPAIVSGIFCVATLITGSVVYIDITRMFFTQLRSRVQALVLRRLTGRGLPLGRIRVNQMSTIRFAENALFTAHSGLFIPLTLGVFSQMLINFPRIVMRSNHNVVYDLNQTANEAWNSGDIMAVGQTFHFLLCMLLLFINTFFFVSSVRRHLNRRSPR
ncbi:Protein of unknown function (DUF687) [Chlamydia serpentis]|uniref:Uncharacterized protein n=1 Tax=Chlamydia serpentis TaxID=1967782 RepID=A0A2R8F9Y5_9CHLA|nr:DUF687 family protein [Chlamydia serpentis]SPN73235.1 Protein of unknown function (DUF687) [Chlamydia serpentis]